jgi:hypothetical protein
VTIEPAGSLFQGKAPLFTLSVGRLRTKAKNKRESRTRTQPARSGRASRASAGEGPCFLHTSSRFPRCCEPTIMDQGSVSGSNRATLFCALAKRKHLITRSTSINRSADRGYSGHPTLVFARSNKASAFRLSRRLATLSPGRQRSDRSSRVKQRSVEPVNSSNRTSRKSRGNPRKD